MTTPFPEMLCSSDVAVRRKALLDLLALTGELNELNELGYEGLERAIVAQLHHEEPVIRELAAEILTNIDDTDPEVVPELLAALDDNSALVREQVLVALKRYRLEPGQRSLVQARLADREGRVRIQAARLLWAQFTDVQAVKSEILEALASGQVDCVIQACQLAAELHSERHELAPLLYPLLQHRDGAVRGNALYALSRLEDDRQRLLEAAAGVNDDLHPLEVYILSKLRKEAAAQG